MKSTQDSQGNLDNVYDLFSGQPVDSLVDEPIIRLAPELDGLEMLYSNNAHPGKLFAMKILAWGLCKNGDVCGLIPWMDHRCFMEADAHAMADVGHVKRQTMFSKAIGTQVEE